MTNKNDLEPMERLIVAYEDMLKRISHTVEHAGEEAIPNLKHNIEQAREKAVELGELSREEAEKVARYLERDMEEVAHYMGETGEQLADWWQFESSLIEGRLLDAFSSIADQTSLELAKLAQQAREASTYHTGEITGPGTLICTKCGEEIHFHKTGHIPPCPKCHHTEYKRVMSSAEDESVDTE
jgi:NADH pyrophosphatase NudC (nudix superfamily)